MYSVMCWFGHSASLLGVIRLFLIIAKIEKD
jgi:hypothetical protein